MDQARDDLILDNWASIASRLGSGHDLTDWARSCGAFDRPRKIRDGATLLRLALAYGACGLSLRQAALWAAGEGLADLSDEALYKRLAKTGGWLAEIAGALLDGVSASSGRRLRIVDGTTLTAPGSSRPTWRLMLEFDPDAQRLCGLTLSSARCGESLVRGGVEPGELIVADRGFARAAGLASVRRQKGEFLVRLGLRSLRLLDAKGNRIELDKLLGDASLRQAGHRDGHRDGHGGGPGDIDQTVTVAGMGVPAFQARLIARPLPPAAAERNKGKLARAGQQEGYTPSEAARTTAGYIILLTSMAPDALSASAAVQLYRLRWQVELAIKRMKSLGKLDRLPAKSPGLAQTWILANLIAMLLTETVAADLLDSPPSGP